MPGRPCAHVLPGGQRCRGFATTGSNLCFAHDPDRTVERTAARRAGGRAPRGRVDTAAAAMPVRTTEDVLALIETTINEVRAGSVDPRIGNAIGYLANITVKILEQRDIEDRLDALEAVLDDKRKQAVAARRRA